jgi:hypothetical protein
MERREHPRFRVRYRSSFSAVSMVAGEGVLQELSLKGCRVASTTSVQPGTELELRVAVPGEVPALKVELAVVRWAREKQFGLSFVALRPEEQERLARLLSEFDLYQQEHSTEEREDP